MLLILLSVALLALSSVQASVSESSSEESLRTVLDETSSDSSSDEDVFILSLMNLSQVHPHQRSNLSRVQMKTHHQSNLKVIVRA
ncbi:hypothetical protein R6Z07M_005202 [Ovis aries]